MTTVGFKITTCVELIPPPDPVPLPLAMEIVRDVLSLERGTAEHCRNRKLEAA